MVFRRLLRLLSLTIGGVAVGLLLCIGANVCVYVFLSARPDAQALARDVAKMASMPDGLPSGCFRGFLSGFSPSVRARLESSVVVVHVQGSRHLGPTGSGFVVAGSATAGSPFNKVLTASHLVRPDAVIRLTSATGMELGRFRVIWKGPSQGGADDAAVLERVQSDGSSGADAINLPSPGLEAYKSIEGLELATSTSPTWDAGTELQGTNGGLSSLTGMLHPGVGVGMSGAPLVNGQAMVHALTSHVIRHGSERVLQAFHINPNEVTLPGMLSPAGIPGPANASILTEARATMLNNPDLLAALGMPVRAGGTTAQMEMDMTSLHDLHAVGYLRGRCVSVPMNMHTTTK